MRPTRWPRCAPVAALLFAATAAAQDEAEAPPEPVSVLRAGFVHPVGAPVIEDGVVVIQGARILAVGRAGEVEIPAGAVELAFPGAHAYPGLVDAASAAFCPPAVLDSNATDAGSELGPLLDPFDAKSRALVAHGVTTAYVAGRGATTWRGLGHFVRPTSDGFGELEGAPPAAVHLRMTAGPGASNALARERELATAGDAFDELEAYEKARSEHATKLAEYQKKFDEYVAHHEKLKAEGKSKPAPAAVAPPSEGQSGAGGEGERRGGRRGPRRRPPGGDEPAPSTPPAPSQPAPEPPPAAQDPKPAAPAGGEAAAPKPEQAPARPTFPKAPEADPAKDALLDVRDGKRALRVEAQRRDEIEATLALDAKRQVATLVLEGAAAAAPHARALAGAGIAVVVTSLDAPARSPYGDDRLAEPIGALHAAGVPIAIGSGSVAHALHLPLLAARAAALGMGRDDAVRAITLTPAEVLGIADRVGSLAPGKLADVLVTTAPLLDSDARTLLVLAGGATAYRAP